jgi:hypothetical protein
VVVVVKAAVTIDPSVRPFFDDVMYAALEKIWMKLRAGTPLNAVSRPQRLCPTCDLNLIKDSLPFMVLGEADVFSRMPVLGGDHDIEGAR